MGRKKKEITPIIEETKAAEEMSELQAALLACEASEPNDLEKVEDAQPVETVAEDVAVNDQNSVEDLHLGSAVLEYMHPIAEESTTEAIPEAQPVPKKLSPRKEKKYARLRKRLLNPVDIKYRGIFSYRYLRAFAWLAIAVSQIVLLHNANENAYNWLFFMGGSATVLHEVADMSMPLFLVATFAYILNRNRSHLNMLSFYIMSYLGIAIFEVFVFRRYAISVMTAMGVEAKATAQLIGLLVGQKVQVNIFSDLCVLTAFNFFINYTPKKYFQGKKMWIFRAMCILPLLLSIASYVVRWLGANDEIFLPIDVYPFLTTKSPYVHIIFIIISLWIKYRERLFINLGASRREYEQFLRTNRNSLAFSIQVSVLFAIFSVIDLLTMTIFLVVGQLQGFDTEVVLSYAQSIGIGQCVGLFFTIPIVLLFSYTKNHKNPSIDIIVPIVGVGLFVLVYMEGVYEIVINSIKTLMDSVGGLGA